MLTESQNRAIERLQEKFSPADGYEIKRQVLETLDCGVVFYHYETGLIGDEGTLAEAFARTRRWFKLGKRGAIESYDGNSSKWKRDLFSTL